MIFNNLIKKYINKYIYFIFLNIYFDKTICFINCCNLLKKLYDKKNRFIKPNNIFYSNLFLIFIGFSSLNKLFINFKFTILTKNYLSKIKYFYKFINFNNYKIKFFNTCKINTVNGFKSLYIVISDLFYFYRLIFIDFINNNINIILIFPILFNQLIKIFKKSIFYIKLYLIYYLINFTCYNLLFNINKNSILIYLFLYNLMIVIYENINSIIKINYFKFLVIGLNNFIKLMHTYVFYFINLNILTIKSVLYKQFYFFLKNFVSFNFINFKLIIYKKIFFINLFYKNLELIFDFLIEKIIFSVFKINLHLYKFKDLKIIIFNDILKNLFIKKYFTNCNYVYLINKCRNYIIKGAYNYLFYVDLCKFLKYIRIKFFLKLLIFVNSINMVKIKSLRLPVLIKNDFNQFLNKNLIIVKIYCKNKYFYLFMKCNKFYFYKYNININFIYYLNIYGFLIIINFNKKKSLYNYIFIKNFIL